MTGKDLFFGLRYIGDDLVAEAEFAVFGNQTTKASAPGTPGGQRKAAKKGMLIAAMITILLLLTGFTLLFSTLDRLVVPRDIPETTSSPVVAQNILSLQGYEGSPTYQALSEWLAFQVSYVAQDPKLRFNSDFGGRMITITTPAAPRKWWKKWMSSAKNTGCTPSENRFS